MQLHLLCLIAREGKLFINPQDKVYEGMIVGEHSRKKWFRSEPAKGKKLTNIRASGTDEAVKLIPSIKMSLRKNDVICKSDELLEVTPNSLRLRKKELRTAFRKKKPSS